MLALWMAWIFLRLNAPRVFEGKPGDARGGLLGDDLQALDHAGHNFVLDARVQSLGVFAHHHQIDAGIARGHRRQIADGPEVGEQLKLLAQRHVDAGKAAADGRRHRAFQSNMGALNGLGEFFGDVLFVLFEGFGAGSETFPLELDAGSFQDADTRVHDLGPDAIAGY